MFTWCCKKKVTKIDPYDPSIPIVKQIEQSEDQDFSGSKEEGFDTRSNQATNKIREAHRVPDG